MRADVKPRELGGPRRGGVSSCAKSQGSNNLFFFHLSVGECRAGVRRVMLVVLRRCCCCWPRRPCPFSQACQTRSLERLELKRPVVVEGGRPVRRLRGTESRQSWFLSGGLLCSVRGTVVRTVERTTQDVTRTRARVQPRRDTAGPSRFATGPWQGRALLARGGLTNLTNNVVP